MDEQGMKERRNMNEREREENIYKLWNRRDPECECMKTRLTQRCIARKVSCRLTNRWCGEKRNSCAQLCVVEKIWEVSLRKTGNFPKNLMVTQEQR
jgi:hypothetical protein